jgi:hypothetical protein
MDKNKNILLLTYWGYREPLISNFLIPNLRLIHQATPQRRIFLVTLDKAHQQLSSVEKSEAAEFLSEFNAELVSFPYQRFGPRAFAMVANLIARLFFLIVFRKIGTIHAFCTPAGAVGLFLSKLTGRRLLLDCYEPHAECMVESGTWSNDSIAFRLLFWLEAAQSKAASIFISTTEEMRTYAASKYKVDVRNFWVRPCCVDTKEIGKQEHVKNRHYLERLGFEDKVVGLYSGKFGGMYLIEETFLLIRAAQELWGDRFRMLVTSNVADEWIREKEDEFNIKSGTIARLFVSLDELPYYMGTADFALTPVKPIPSKRYCSPIKNGEYWSLGLPVIIPANISDDSNIIAESEAGYVLESLVDTEYRAAMIWIDEFLRSPDLADRKEQIRQLAQQHRSLDRALGVYREVYS